MKVKMSGLSSLKSEAKRLGVSERVVRDYQAARKAWNDRIRWYANKYGGIESGEKAIDIRNVKAYRGEDTEEFLRSRIETLKSRTSHAADYLRRQQQIYLENLFKRGEGLGADIWSLRLEKWLKIASKRELASVIDIIGTDILDVYYEETSKENANYEQADENLVTAVQRALQNITLPKLKDGD